MNATPSDAPPPVTWRRIDHHVAWVTLDRPRRANAVNAALAQALGEIVARVEDDAELRVAVLCGTGGKVFCAGADLHEVAAGRFRELSTPEGGFAGFTFARRSKPWIASVAGAALGGGFEIVLACDMVVAAAGATFGLPEAARGLVASAGGAWRLPRAIPRAVAIELLTTGAPIDASHAHRLGLVNRVVANDALDAESLRLALSIAANSPLAVREALALGRAACDSSEADLRERSRQASDRVRASPDAAEGPRAFIEKRQPQWRT